MFSNNVIVTLKQGIHLRIAAEIVKKSGELEEKYSTQFYIRKSTDHEAVALSMLALLSLRIGQGEIIEITVQESSSKSKEAIDKLTDFINDLMRQMDPDESVIDGIIEQTQIANEQIIQSIPAGVVVVDGNASILMMNRYGLSIINKTSEEVMGKSIIDIFPSSELKDTIANKKYKIGCIKHYEDKTIIVNSSPIFLENDIIGAVEIFQDASELEGVKELNEKFKRIINTSGDLICFVDENRRISYINPAYQSTLPESSDGVLGKDLEVVSPNGLRMKVFNSGEKVENVLNRKENVDIVSTIEPLYIDGKFKGIISISKPISHIRSLLKKLEESEERVNYYREELLRQTPVSSSFRNIIGCEGSLRDSVAIAEKASRSTSTVLVRGESGTGKELIAKAIHNASDRRDKPFIRVNCAAIPENLLESELFGYEKGAFTGAMTSKPGKFTIADTGTIFLDEIGDMHKSMQVKLLRVLQEREFESVGGLVTRKVDIRVLAATNRNLEEMIAAGEFREDLYYRLNVMSILLPPLRERKEDIPVLAEHFVDIMNKKIGKKVSGISSKAMEMLQMYNYQGNIRELENIIERAVNMCDGSMIREEDLPAYITNITHHRESLINVYEGEMASFEEYEKEIIQAAIRRYKSFNKAGKALGLTHRTISLKCKKYNIETE